MFTDLFTLVQQTPVSLLITAVGQELRIIITPHCSKADDLPLQAEHYDFAIPKSRCLP